MIFRTAATAVLCTLALTTACATPQTALSPEPTAASASGELRILFVGNSLTYSNQLPEMVADLLTRSGLPATVETVAFPNYGLEDHWNDRRTRRKIRGAGWSHVVFQQGPSATQGRPSLLAYARRFAPEVRAVGAEPAFYMVWPSARRSFDFDGVSQSYRMAADAVDGLLLPAGDAWRAVWRHDSDAELYGEDGFHPSTLGSYVAALTIADLLAGGALEPAPRVRTSRGGLTLEPAQAEMLLAAVREVRQSR